MPSRDAVKPENKALTPSLNDVTENFAYLTSDFEKRMENAFVHSFVVFIACWSEDLPLHSCSDDPEWICDYVAEEATYPCWDRVQTEGVFMPTIFLFEMQFALFV